MREVCPRCGREGYRVIKYVTGSTGFRLYAVEYFRHHRGRPKWCYIRRRPDLDPPLNCWWETIRWKELGTTG